MSPGWHSVAGAKNWTTCFATPLGSCASDPHQIAIRLTEKWWGWRERGSVSSERPDRPAVPTSAETPILLDSFRRRPFYAFSAGDEQIKLIEAFHRFFPGRVDLIRDDAARICEGTVSLFGQAVLRRLWAHS